MSELAKRIIFGIIAAVVGTLAIYAGSYIFYLFVIFLSFLISLEFDRLRKDGKISFAFCVVPILIAHYPLIALLMVLLAVIMIMIAQYSSKITYPWLIASIIYISLPAISLLWLREQADGFRTVFWLLLVIVTMDSGAYFAGKMFGKNLLAPKISPKKTWEGFAGGVFLAALVSYFYTGQERLVAMAIVFAVVAQVSDLLESAIKRFFEVKNTGNIIPGHGGLMDRTDSFVLTAPLLAVALFYGVIIW